MPDFAVRILPVDIPVALECARLHVSDRRSERGALIAATALVRGMTVVTTTPPPRARAVAGASRVSGRRRRVLP